LTARITEWLPFMAPLNELQNMRSEGGTTDPWLRTGTFENGYPNGRALVRAPLHCSPRTPTNQTPAAS